MVPSDPLVQVPPDIKPYLLTKTCPVEEAEGADCPPFPQHKSSNKRFPPTSLCDSILQDLTCCLASEEIGSGIFQPTLRLLTEEGKIRSENITGAGFGVGD